MFSDRFARDGCLVIDKLFDPALIDAMREEYERQYARINLADPPPHMKVGRKRLHLPVVLRGALLDPDLCANPLLLGILTGLLEDSFVIDNVSVVTAMPGANDQRYHRDYPDLFPLGRLFDGRLPCYAITVAIPLIDLTPESGTTELFPGTVGVTANEDTAEFGPGILPFLKRGGCFFMDYRVWHRGRANKSHLDRPILYIVYAREWFTDIRNFAKHSRLIVDPAEANRIPVSHRALFRRAAGKGLLDATIEELLESPETSSHGP